MCLNAHPLILRFGDLWTHHEGCALSLYLIIQHALRAIQRYPLLCPLALPSRVTAPGTQSGIGKWKAENSSLIILFFSCFNTIPLNPRIASAACRLAQLLTVGRSAFSYAMRSRGSGRKTVVFSLSSRVYYEKLTPKHNKKVNAQTCKKIFVKASNNEGERNGRALRCQLSWLVPSCAPCSPPAPTV
jgi:hypothetical protein